MPKNNLKSEVAVLQEQVREIKENHLVHLALDIKTIDEKIETYKDAFNSKIDMIFDGYTREYGNLGNSSNLSKTQQQERADVYAVASALALRRNVPVEKMISKAITLFKNQGGEKAAEQKVINKLNKQEKRLTNKPTRRASQQSGERKFSSDYEEAEYLMAEAEQKAGLQT